MSTYMPGNGVKKPLNMLQAPVYPDIRKAPPRFVWSKKHWNVDTGQTLKQVEDIPQFFDSTVLFQSRDYNSQHAYGKYPTYTDVVNKAFRPPLIDRDDILPLSRIPRPPIVPRNNPGTAFGGGGVYQAQNSTPPPELHKFITDRVKSASIRPTFFAPLYTPVDNSVLPDLELTLPSVSASAGFLYNTNPLDNFNQNIDRVIIDDNDMINVSGTAGNKFNNNGMLVDGDISGREYFQNIPSVSAFSGNKFNNNGMLVDEDISGIEYFENIPSVSAVAGTKYNSNGILQPSQKELFESRPRISMTSGRREKQVNKLESPNYQFSEKIEGNQTYVNPNNTYYKTENFNNDISGRTVPYQKKSSAYAHTTPYTVGGFMPRSGVTVSNVNLKEKKL